MPQKYPSIFYNIFIMCLGYKLSKQGDFRVLLNDHMLNVK